MRKAVLVIIFDAKNEYDEKLRPTVFHGIKIPIVKVFYMAFVWRQIKVIDCCVRYRSERATKLAWLFKVQLCQRK